MEGSLINYDPNNFKPSIGERFIGVPSLVVGAVLVAGLTARRAIRYGLGDVVGAWKERRDAPRTIASIAALAVKDVVASSLDEHDQSVAS